ncbi:choice-of-anchor K domain-containing protein [Roseobacter sp.]|uniref:choice-of-anchor K domain-containing protein n=1 Tax=Roseobacter sp. TaxID=1907202 RepID=UPI00385D093C
MFKHLAIAGVFTIGVVSTAHASTVSGSFSGTIGAPSGATNPSIQYIGAGTSKLEWGTPGYGQTTVASGDSSSLTINDLDFSFDKDDLKAGSVLLGTITWNNQSNWHTGSDWSSSVNLNIDFLVPSAVSLGQSVAFGITNTPDKSYNTNKNEQTGNNPDLISDLVLDANAFGVPIKLGDDYKLTSVFFSHEAVGKGSTYDPSTGLWTNVEGGTTSIGIYGEISAVPLPAGMWLMLAGLGSLAAMRRRKKSVLNAI